MILMNTMNNILPAVIGAVIGFCVALFNFKFTILYDGFSNAHNGYNKSRIFDGSSSVWCHVVNGTQLCTFKNLCYFPDTNQFFFTLTEQSVLFGLKSKEDLMSIQLSTVLNHNLMYMKIIVGIENEVSKNSILINEPLFLLWRFKWDNIMHVLHDDILPLFLTFLSMCKDIDVCVSTYTLAFVDRGEPGSYSDLYSLFSKQKPIFLHNFRKTVCIHEIHTGVLNTSIWFQYGFGIKQGPTNFHAPLPLIQHFKDYILQNYGTPSKNIRNDTVLFFNRKLNRRILNVKEFRYIVSNTIKEMYPLSQPEIIEVDLATHNLSFILNLMLNSRIVVGMHGSAMILALFLHSGSILVELFPFGVQPKYVSFIKAYSNIKGNALIYKSWINYDENNSIPHPEAPALLGGIHHLPKSKQELIRNTKIVPPVECCHNPLYLYRMFQDTVVGMDFKSVFLDALIDQTVFSKESLNAVYMNDLISLWYFPAPVTNISCYFHELTFAASWSPPINALGPLVYDIAVMLDNGTSIHRKSSVCLVEIELNYKAMTAELWIKLTHDESVDSYYSCERKV